MSNYDNSFKRSKLDWVAIVLAIATAIFSAGGFIFRVGALETEVTNMKQELVRKDVLGAQISNLDWKIENIDKKIDRVLESAPTR